MSACQRCGIPSHTPVCRDCRDTDPQWLNMAGDVPTFRTECGTAKGIRLHAEYGEQTCGHCLAGDDARKLQHEARQPIPEHPAGPMRDLRSVIGLLAQVMREAS